MRRLLLLAFLTGFAMEAQVKIEKASFSGWPNCYRISNGEAELIVTSDIGPRIMFYGFRGGQNVLWVQKETAGKSGEPEWVARGGHRIWIAPEDPKYTYPPDNSPVQIEVRGDTLVATQPTEKETNIQKQLEIRMAPRGTEVVIIHRLFNRGIMPLEFAPWALTMMAPGGHGVSGFPPRGTHPKDLAPTNPLVMWAYTDLGDPRWTWLRKYFVLRQDPANSTPMKIGHFNPKTWGAYFLNGELFLKRYDADPSKTYPDFGCSFETFTNADFLELETLGPITKVAPGGVVEHVERWSLHRPARPAAWTDAELDRILGPLLASK